MSFSDDVSRWAKKSVQLTENVYKEAAIELFTRIIMDTPIGDPSLWMSKPPPGYVGGTLRGAWYTSFNRPSHINNPDYSRKDTSAKEVVAIIRHSRNKDAYFLTNNMPYVKRVEYGHSSQAPKGMVRLNVADWDNIVKRVNIRMKQRRK